MGSVCLRESQTNDPPQKKPKNKYAEQPPKSRVNETDKAILEVKARQRKLKTYIDKLTIDAEKSKVKIQEYLKDKQKQRALIALKQKKFLEKEIEKAMGASTMLQQSIQNIESAQMDVQIFEAMKKGDQVLTELQSKASLENFEELYEKHQEHQARQEMEQELFGQVLNEDDLQDELDKLDAMIMEESLPEAAQNRIGDADAKEYQEKHGIKAQQEEVEPAQATTEKRKMVLA